MAADPEPTGPVLVELRDLSAGDLDNLLEEETADWKRRLDWDFSPSADLVRRFVRMSALGGFALVWHGCAVGYTYFVCEDRKGLIGDLYVRHGLARAENEQRLLRAAVDALAAMPRIQRVESQLMMMDGSAGLSLPHAGWARGHWRNFMVAELGPARRLPAHAGASNWIFDNWSDRRQDQAAQLIAAAYHGHVDSDINDQYRSQAGARRFLANIVQYPGCGTFFQPASWLATQPASSRLAGLCLTSLVAHDVGHITQVCVAPDARAAGLGYELIRRSMVGLAEAGCREASLTVTVSNERAVELYRRMGYCVRHRFQAYVWEFPARQKAPGY